MNEIEERNSLDPEEVAQSAIESDISYVGVVQLNTILLGIREGIIPTIEPYDEAPHTYKLYFNDGFILYINEHQYSMIIEEIRNHEGTEEELIESLPESEDSSPLSEEQEE